VVVIVNLPGVKDGDLVLDGETVAAIFLGEISAWDDARIKALNPDVNLPRMKINVVHRADSSGTTCIFTDYLTKVSATWADKVGTGAEVRWPVGIGGQKNPGVCNNVARMRGAIGYTEYTYATQAKLAMTRLVNTDGKTVSPTPASFGAAAVNADWEHASGFQLMLTAQPGEQAWPIVGVTYILLPADTADKAKGEALKRYFEWCLTGGAAAAAALDYVPMGPEMIKMIKTHLEKTWTIAGSPVKF